MSEARKKLTNWTNGDFRVIGYDSDYEVYDMDMGLVAEGFTSITEAIEFIDTIVPEGEE